MARIRIDDRAALERAYPPEAFAADAAENSAAASQTIAGVRILSAPDKAGIFEFERGRRQVGEMSSVPFLAPDRRNSTDGEPAAAAVPAAGYQSFLNAVVNAARRCGYEPETSPGPGDPRIRGPRQ
jgi:hypothetical protein